jgi:hypothetical protein
MAVIARRRSSTDEAIYPVSCDRLLRFARNDVKGREL